MVEVQGGRRSERIGSRELALLGLGALLSIFLGLVRTALATSNAPLEPAGRVQYWAADRDGDHVFGLDSKLLLRTKKPVRRPLRVAGRVDGGVWILHAQGTREEPHGLLRLDEWGKTEAAVTLAEPLDLATWRGRDALVIERGTGTGGLDRVLRVDAAGHRTSVHEAAQLRCLATRGDEVLVGDAQGGVTRLGLEEPGGAQRSLPCASAAAALAPAENGPGWWLLSSDLECTLTRLGRDLEPLWSTGTHLGAPSLVVSDEGERVWLADETRPILRLHGPRGRLEWQRDVSLAGLGRGTRGPEGGVLFAAPGALLHFDGHGQPRPGQGGFRFLVDVDAVPERSSGAR